MGWVNVGWVEMARSPDGLGGSIAGPMASSETPTGEPKAEASDRKAKRSGLAGERSSRERPNREHAGPGARARLAARALDHLPLGVGVIDGALRLHYWNLQAGFLFGMPSVLEADRPTLDDALRVGGRLTQDQRERVVAFCSDVVAAAGSSLAGEGDVWLRIAHGRQSRLVFKLNALGRDRWLLAIDDLRADALAEREAPRDAMVDALTGLCNRRHFHEALRDALRNPDCRQAVMVINLDRFKPINDTWGQAVGDALLCLVAKRLRREIRDVDLLARLGGDAFAILQPDGDSAERLAERLIHGLSRPFLVEGHMVSIGASIGIARPPAQEAATRSSAIAVEAVVQQAEIALRAAKRAGRQSWRTFDPTMPAEAADLPKPETDLRAALSLGQIGLVYHPRLDVRMRTLTAAEAAPHWLRPHIGALGGAALTKLALEAGIAVELDEHLLQAACRDAAAWPEHVSVAVTLSSRSLVQPDRLLAAVRAALDMSGLAAQRLEIGLPAAELLRDDAAVPEMLHRLRGIGVQVVVCALDFASPVVNRLHDLPVERIRIDRALISGPSEDAIAALIIRAHGLRAVTVGVETPGQAALALAQGCGDIQGKLAGQPMQAAAVAAFSGSSHGAPIQS